MLNFSQVYYNSFFILCKQFHRYFTKNFQFIVKFFIKLLFLCTLLSNFVKILLKLFYFTNFFMVFLIQKPRKRFLFTLIKNLLIRRLLCLLEEPLFKVTFIDNFLLCSQFSFSFSLAVNKITFINPAILCLVGTFTVKCSIFKFTSISVAI